MELIVSSRLVNADFWPRLAGSKSSAPVWQADPSETTLLYTAEVDTTIAVASALVAVISAVVSGLYARRSNRIQEQGARDAYLERVRDWADVTVEVTTELLRLCREGCGEATFTSRKGELRTRLSAQVEKGRWFFPNVLREHVGQRKEAAYRGLRQPILDHLIDIFNATDDLDWDGRHDARPRVLEGQRAFVSEVQVRLDPNRRDDLYQQLQESYIRLEENVEGW